MRAFAVALVCCLISSSAFAQGGPPQCAAQLDTCHYHLGQAYDQAQTMLAVEKATETATAAELSRVNAYWQQWCGTTPGCAVAAPAAAK